MGGTTSTYQKYWYDANGNATRRKTSLDITLTYDYDNHLTAVSGAKSFAYLYDGDGRLVKVASGIYITAVVGSYYEYAGSTPKKHYFAGATRMAVRDNNTLFFLLTDHLGSTAVTTDNAGASPAELRYRAFGLTRLKSGTQKTAYRYTGQRIEGGTDLYHYGARWYDPVVGRFLQADTIVPNPGNPQSLNRYAYTFNNPLRYTDPTGHSPIIEWGGGGSVALWPSPWPAPVAGGLLVGLAQQAQALVANVGMQVVEATQMFGAQMPSAIDTTVKAAQDAGQQVQQTLNQGGNAASPNGFDPNQLKQIREQYETAVRGLTDVANQLKSAGKTAEEIARTVSAQRRALGELYKSMTPPEQLEQIYARNLERYGDPLGPTIEWLRAHNKTWEQIIESACQSGGADIIPKLLGQ